MTPVGSDPDNVAAFADLQRVVGALAAQVATLQNGVDQHDAVVALKDAEIAALKDEIARLKGLPPRPKFKAKPSGMEQATSKAAGKKGRKRGRGSVRDRLAVTCEVSKRPGTSVTTCPHPWDECQKEIHQRAIPDVY
jgi:hypothetical protein